MASSDKPELWPINGYVAPKGQGKTTLGLKEFRRFPRQILVNLNELDDTLKKGAKVIRTREELRDYLKSKGKSAPFKVCWEGHLRYGDEEAAHIAIKYALAAGNLGLFLDEAQRYIPRNWIPHPHLNRLFTQNRHARVAVSWTSVTPKMHSPELRANTDCMNVFRCFRSNFMSYYKENAPELVEKLKAAPQYSYLKVYMADAPELVIAKKR